LRPLFFSNVTAAAVVAWRLLPFHLLLSHLLKTLRGAIAEIGIATFHQTFGYIPVYLQTLRLKIGAIIPSHTRTFVPVQTQPPETIEDGLGCPFNFSGDIGVLDT
jgi:hypothetical protein